MGAVVVYGLIGLVIAVGYILDKLEDERKSFQNNEGDKRDPKREGGFSRIIGEAGSERTKRSFSNSKKDTFWEIEIRGTEDFILKTKGALCILMNSKLFVGVKKSLRRIDQTAKFGMHVDSKVFGLAGHDDITFPPIYYATAIAHDTYHSYLYERGDCWDGIKEERKCVEFEMRVLKELRVDDREACFLMKYLEEVRRILLIREMNGLDFDGWEAIEKLANRYMMGIN